jgi:SAM-dependent methyltransferase
MNALQRIEYVALRLLRRFVISEGVANRFARWLPYYKASVNETEPLHIVQEYRQSLSAVGIDLRGKRVCEVGTGRTNAVGYGLIAAGSASAILLEPYIPYDANRDDQLRLQHPALLVADKNRVQRVTTFAEVPSSSIDLLLSNSVLEHVSDTRTFFNDCRRVLAPGGSMLHRVDYRDHFFKYPYAFLTFSQKTWSHWLDPGDLPRWRLTDHLRDLADCGFSVSVSDKQKMSDAFEQIRPRLTERFSNSLADVDVTFATLVARATR